MQGEMLGRSVVLILFPLLLMTIFGGLYVLFARPRITFRQAMFRWWIVLLALGITLLGIIGQIVNGITQAT